MKVDVELKGVKEAREFLKTMPDELRARVISRMAQVTHDEAAKRVDEHTKTGKLLLSLKLQRVGDAFEVGHVTREAPHALFLHEGTGLYGPKRKKYPIEPKRKFSKRGKGRRRASLRWPAGEGGDTEFFYRRKVMHPGVKAQKWLVKARDSAARNFPRLVQKVWNTWR